MRGGEPTIADHRDDEIRRSPNSRRRSRIAALATAAADGRPRLVAMWYAVIDGEDLVRDEVEDRYEGGQPAAVTIRVTVLERD